MRHLLWHNVSYTFTSVWYEHSSSFALTQSILLFSWWTRLLWQTIMNIHGHVTISAPLITAIQHNIHLHLTHSHLIEFDQYTDAFTILGWRDSRADTPGVPCCLVSHLKTKVCPKHRNIIPPYISPILRRVSFYLIKQNIHGVRKRASKECIKSISVHMWSHCLHLL